MKKFILILLSLVFIFSGLNIITSAEGNTQSTPENNKIHALIPNGYKMKVSVLGYEDADTEDVKLHYFKDEKEEQVIDIIVTENKELSNGGIESISDDLVDNILSYYYSKSDDLAGIMISNSEKIEINGLKAYKVISDLRDSERTEGKYKFHYFETYFIATKKNIFIISYITYGEKIDEENRNEINLLLKELTVNGSYFEGEKPTVDYSFTFKPSLKRFAEKNDENILHSDDYINDFFDTMEEEGFSTFEVISYSIVIIGFFFAMIYLLLRKINKKIK